MVENYRSEAVIGLLVHPDHQDVLEGGLGSLPGVVCAVADEVHESLGACLTREPDVLVLVGDDAFVGEVVGAYESTPALKAFAFRLLPTRVRGSAHLAEELESPVFGGSILKRALKASAAGGVRYRGVRSLRVVTSCDARARFGFNLGAGLVFDLFEAFARAGGRGGVPTRSVLLSLGREVLRAGGSAAKTHRARLSVDGESLAEAIGYLICSSLAETWLGVSMVGGGGLGLRVGDRGAELIKEAAAARMLPAFARREGGERFERVDVDWSGGFVLDGVLFEPGVPYTLRVEAGPKVACVSAFS